VIQPFFENPRNLSKTHKIPSSILFCGALYRKENFLSILWFAKNILPQIKSVVKDVKFYIVGARPPLKVLRLHDGITIFVISDVPNLAEYYQSCEIFVAPLLYGAGIKVKVLEAMAHGMPVITNDVGIEGIPAVAERDFVYYRTSSELRDKVLMLLTNSSLREEIGRNARQLITEHFDFDQSVQQLLALYKSLMVETPGHRSL